MTRAMRTTTADRFVEGLQSLGWAIHQWCELRRNYGQPMMNRAACEAAPCWEILAFFGDGSEVIIQGHVPALWTLKFPPSEWSVDDDYYSSYGQKRLHIDPPRLPPKW